MENTITSQEFLKIVNKHRGQIGRLCRVYTRTEEDRSDLFQDILVQLWNSFPAFRGDSKVGTFIYKVAFNTACSYFKKEIKRADSMKQYCLESFGETDEGNETTEQICRLYEAISKLEPVERAVIMLYLDDMSAEETASVIGISVNNVNVKVHRIKAKLQRMLVVEKN